MMRSGWMVSFAILACIGAVRADGERDNIPEKVRRIPPDGIAVPDADREALQAGLAELGKEIEGLQQAFKKNPTLLELLPDVKIYFNSVRYALTHNEFLNAREITLAKAQLQQGLERAKNLKEGKAPWTKATGLVVRGYISRIDESVQPYGILVPDSYRPAGAKRHRLDVWLHGRNETLTETNFIDQCQRSGGPFTPANAFVLQPYGRYINANKFAGEVDLFEALAQVRKQYPIDENRIAVRGFSMGGAACWQFAVHHAGHWAAAAPGAGFSETADFLKVFQKETLQPSWYEQKLWHLYDCTDYAANLTNCPTVAYSGTIDSQKQAADMMAKACASEGIDLVHILGPNTGHAYHPEAKIEVAHRIDSIVARGRDPLPARVRFTTWTLRYNQMFWVRVDGLEQHWERARVAADLLSDGSVKVKTTNVAALTLEMPPGYCPLDVTRKPSVSLDEQILEATPVKSDRSWVVHFRKTDKTWAVVPASNDGVLRKRHGLQGPIDDAFYDRFLMVMPTGKPLNEKVGAWADAESKHAITHWRQQFRGEALVKNDTDVTAADIASSNLILWGDPSSNKVLAKILDKLPIGWDAQSIRVAGKTYDSSHHVPLLIYPNPLNNAHYIVIDSGFTYREYDYLNNARQTPKLPDYAIVDVNTPPNSRFPGKVVTAGFFGELWQIVAQPEK